MSSICPVYQRITKNKKALCLLIQTTNFSFALSISSRPPSGKISAVSCRLCPTLGRHETTIVQKTSRKSFDDAHFTASFLTDNIRKKLTFMQKKWTAYLHSTTRVRLILFDQGIPYCETIQSYYDRSDIRVYKIYRSIIDTIINKVFVFHMVVRSLTQFLMCSRMIKMTFTILK